MSRMTRYGFSREAGRQHIPVPLVRRPAPGVMRGMKGWWPLLGREGDARPDEMNSVASAVPFPGDEKPAAAAVEPAGARASAPAGDPAPALPDVPAGGFPPVDPAGPAPLAAVTAPPPAGGDPAPCPRPSAAPSGMEAPAVAEPKAQQSHSQIPQPPERYLAAAPGATDGKVFCAGCDARVPAWFSRDCIAGDCSLRARA